MQVSWKNPLRALPVLLLAAYAGAVFGAAGSVQFVIGDVKLITKAGATRALVKGAEVDEGDRIVTASGSSAQIRMVDGGFIAVRPNTNMAFDTYHYSGKDDGTGNAILSLLQGGFRAITGIIGHTNKQNYLIRTQTATIGIRGTDHEPMVILPPAPGQAAIGEPGTYDKVNVGIAYIRTDAGSVDIQRNQVGFAPVSRAAPVILPGIPSFYKPTPAPAPQKTAAPATGGGQQAGTGSQDKAAEASSATRSTAVVDPTSVAATAPAAATTASAPSAVTTSVPAAAAPVVALSMTDSNGNTLNATDQTVTSPTGVTTPVSQGTIALQAQTAADQALLSYDAAQAAVTGINTAQTDASTSAGTATALSAVSLAPANTAISTAQPAVTSAQSAVTTAQTLASADTTTATANATTAAALAATAASQASTATTKYNAHGSFADATIAVPAFTALTAANTALQTANTAVQSAAGTASTQNTVLANSQSAAATALGSANTSLTSANSAVTSATAQNAALATAQSAVSSASGSIPAFLTAAQTAASAAQAAAQAAQAAATQAQSLQTAGDFVGAQAQLTIAQQQLAIAQQQQTTATAQLTAAQSAASTAATQSTAAQAAAAAAQTQVTNGVTAANAAATDAATASSSAAAAQTVKPLADAAVAATTSGLSSVQTGAPLVQQNSVLAQYSNPAVASNNFTIGLRSLKPVTGGSELAATSTMSANTNYVLDGSNSLMEIRNAPYTSLGSNYSNATIGNADITFSGGTAADTSNDPNGTYYMGRWSGGQMTVTDLATTNPAAPFTDSLGPASAHWIVGLAPGNLASDPSINNVQQLVGTANYTLAGATHPTDGSGNVGTLNSATLAANFSAQTVNANLNLSFSSTDTVNVSTRNLALAASANNVPILSTGFDAAAGGPFAPTVSCSGTGCAASGYTGDISGMFLASASGGTTTGAVGTGAAISYGFSPVVTAPTANQPYTDLIQGVAALSTGAAPTVGVTNFSSTAVMRDEVLWPTTQIAPGVNPTTTTYTVSDKNRESLNNNLGGTPTSPVTITGRTDNANFLFDANGNLVRVLDTPHVVFDHGNDVPGSSTQFSAPTPLAHAQLSFGGGGAISENYYDPNTSIRFGRWTGGVVNVTDLTTGNGYIDSLTAPGGAALSVQWVVAQMPASLPLTGEFQYTRINGAAGTPSFATAPTDSYGNVGTIEGARLSADFTNMRASAGVRISMPSGPAGSLGVQDLSAHFENAPISNGGFNVSSGSDNAAGTDNLHVGCVGPGCAPDITLTSGAVVSPYGGRIRGAFDSATGNAGTADGAFFRYTFNTLYGLYAATPPTGRVVDDYINGLVAFNQGPQIALPTSTAYPLAAPTGPVVAIANYGYNTAGSMFTGGQTYWLDKPSATNPATSAPYLVTDTAGNLVSLAEDNGNTMHGNGNALAQSGGTANTPISLAIGSSANATDGTILLGWQQPTGTSPLTVSGTDYNGCFGTSGCANSARTVLGDGLSWAWGPAPFPDYLPGAIAGYTNSGGVVVPGTATYTLGASTLHDQSGASGTVNSAGLTVNFNNSSVNFNMAATSSAGNWTATASGIRMNQDGAFYANSGGGPTTINAGTTVAPTTLHDGMSVTLIPTTGTVSNTWGNIEGQLMGIGVGGAGLSYDLNSNLCTTGCSNVTASGALAFSNAQPYSTLTAYQLVAFAAGMNAAGQFDSSENNRIQGGYVSPYRTQTVNGFPVKIDGELPVVVTYGGSCTTNCGPFVNNMGAVYTAAGATGPASIGTATLLESGYDVATGIRWGRYGNGTIGVNDRITGASLGTMDVTTQNTHFIMTGSQSGPTVLPLSGTFSYIFAGGTTPTDSNGNVGTPLTSANASLSANFTTQTVDVALTNLVVGPNTWGASATGIPITNNFFGADKKLGGGGTLTVTSSLGTNTAGSLGGVFTGATGGSAAMLYSLNYGGNSATNSTAVTVSGVAAFRR